MKEMDDEGKYLSVYLSEKSLVNNYALFVSSREMEVIRFLVRGLSTREIADRLSISKLTVTMHIKNLIGKFRVKNREELVRVAKRSFSSRL